MNTKIKTFIMIFAAILIGLISCEEQEYTLEDLTAPTNLQITADIIGQSTGFPNGDGSGDVKFTFSSDNALSYSVDFGDGGGTDIYSSSEIKKFNNVGTKHYRIVVNALGKGGSVTTAIKEIDVYYAFDVDPQIVTLLTGDSATGKTWAVDEDLHGHLGLGPGPGRTDGNAETFIPSWFEVTPNSRSSKGIYDDRYTFTNEKVFTHQTNGDIYGYQDAFAADFDPNTPGVWGGFGTEWILDYPDYTEAFDYDGEETAIGAKTVLTFPGKRGHCGFFNGSHRMMILEITETTMWLRATSTPGTNVATWYVKLKLVP